MFLQLWTQSISILGQPMYYVNPMRVLKIKKIELRETSRNPVTLPIATKFAVNVVLGSQVIHNATFKKFIIA